MGHPQTDATQVRFLSEMVKRTILSVVVIVVAGLLVGLGVNGTRPHDRIKLSRNYFRRVERPTVEGDPKHEFVSVTLDEVIVLYQSPGYQTGDIVFVDARNDEHFEEAHIPGALHIDRYNSDMHFDREMTNLQLAEVIVVYCGGGECEDSILLASEFKYDRGIPQEKIRLFEDGMEAWEEEFLETESGITYE